MNDSNQAFLQKSVHNLFAQSFAANRKSKISSSVPVQDLEFAAAVLLVDLASIDQNFDMVEYQAIVNGLNRIFGTTHEEVQEMVNRANRVLKQLRGTSRFGELLRKNLPETERKAIMDLINEVIMADGKEDGYEIYLREKFKEMLGLSKTS
ncbi:MAG: hypothetical protein D6808_02930 [Candidatus Dadabacteria bacterium]|nr:MAG: hypothetical protein D6808_02930 [Candidatus Dadabacteria bacterium]